MKSRIAPARWLCTLGAIPSLATPLAAQVPDGPGNVLLAFGVD